MSAPNKSIAESPSKHSGVASCETANFNSPSGLHHFISLITSSPCLPKKVWVATERMSLMKHRRPRLAQTSFLEFPSPNKLFLLHRLPHILVRTLRTSDIADSQPNLPSFSNLLPRTPNSNTSSSIPPSPNFFYPRSTPSTSDIFDSQPNISSTTTFPSIEPEP